MRDVMVVLCRTRISSPAFNTEMILFVNCLNTRRASEVSSNLLTLPNVGFKNLYGMIYNGMDR